MWRANPGVYWVRLNFDQRKKTAHLGCNGRKTGKNYILHFPRSKQQTHDGDHVQNLYIDASRYVVGY